MKKIIAWLTGARVADALYEQAKGDAHDKIMTFVVVASVVLVWTNGIKDLIKWVF